MGDVVLGFLKKYRGELKNLDVSISFVIFSCDIVWIDFENLDKFFNLYFNCFMDKMLDYKDFCESVWDKVCENLLLFRFKEINFFIFKVYFIDYVFEIGSSERCIRENLLFF